ncbi:MAG: hypothetical protein ACRDF4_06400 [Rhabdochlamydiaceae bacterium]
MLRGDDVGLSLKSQFLVFGSAFGDFWISFRNTLIRPQSTWKMYGHGRAGLDKIDFLSITVDGGNFFASITQGRD